MTIDHLLRDHAPISSASWALIDHEARERLISGLGARKLVDFTGPNGWQHSATNLGRVEQVDISPVVGVSASRRLTLPLTEVRSEFTLSRSELRSGDRGAQDVDLASLDEAALRMAEAENVAVFHGWEEVGMTGIASASPYADVARVGDLSDYPSRVARAVEQLLRNGVAGPYGLAVGPADYTAIVETTEHGGYLVFDHVKKILNGPIVWAPGVRGGVVLSLRGGDFLFDSGQDLSVGYDWHDRDSLHLYLEQSFSFRVATPEAAIGLAGG